jgi:hypothetical protein
MPSDTCQSYMWVVKNFLQTGLYETFVILRILTRFNENPNRMVKLKKITR